MKKLDIATVIGFSMSFGAVAFEMINLVNGDFKLLYELYFSHHAIFVLIFGGCLGGVFYSFPMHVVKKFIKSFIAAGIEDTGNTDAVSLITELVEYANEARRNGVLALDSKTGDIKDPFIKMGIQLAVDGTAPERIEEILSLEIQTIKKRHEEHQEMFFKMAELAPSYGMIGTLMGLVSMLNNLSDPSSLGPSMAVAMLATFYGAVLANVVCIPVISKLKVKSKEEVVRREMIIAAVLAIQNGDNPRLVKQKLMAYASPKEKIILTNMENAVAT